MRDSYMREVPRTIIQAEICIWATSALRARSELRVHPPLTRFRPGGENRNGWGREVIRASPVTCQMLPIDQPLARQNPSSYYKWELFPDASHEKEVLLGCESGVTPLHMAGC